MKSSMLVILDSPDQALAAALRTALEPHRLDEDSLASTQGRHLDYWVLGSSDFLDPDVLSAYSQCDPEVLAQASYLRNLSADYRTGAVIAPDGTWHDLRDHGWRMLDEPSKANRVALEQWNSFVVELLREHEERIGVEVLVHY